MAKLKHGRPRKVFNPKGICTVINGDIWERLDIALKDGTISKRDFYRDCILKGLETIEAEKRNASGIERLQ